MLHSISQYLVLLRIVEWTGLCTTSELWLEHYHDTRLYSIGENITSNMPVPLSSKFLTRTSKQACLLQDWLRPLAPIIPVTFPSLSSPHNPINPC
jgi:hypothetical protein